MSRIATEQKLMKEGYKGAKPNAGGANKRSFKGRGVAGIALALGGGMLADAIGPEDEQGNKITSKGAAKKGNLGDTAQAIGSSAVSGAATGAGIGLMFGVPLVGAAVGGAAGTLSGVAQAGQGLEQKVNEKEFADATAGMDSEDKKEQLSGLRKMRTAIGNRYDKKAGRKGMADIRPYAASLMTMADKLSKLSLKEWRNLPVEDFVFKSKQLGILLDAFSKTFIAVDSGLDPKDADKLYLKLLQANSFVQKIMNEDREITNKTGNWFGFGKDERKYKGAQVTRGGDARTFGLGDKGISQIPSMARKSLGQAKPSTMSGDKTTASLADLTQPKSTEDPGLSKPSAAAAGKQTTGAAGGASTMPPSAAPVDKPADQKTDKESKLQAWNKRRRAKLQATLDDPKVKRSIKSRARRKLAMMDKADKLKDPGTPGKVSGTLVGGEVTEVDGKKVEPGAVDKPVPKKVYKNSRLDPTPTDQDRKDAKWSNLTSQQVANMRVEDAKVMDSLEADAKTQAVMKKSTPGAVAGAAAAKTATIDESAVRRETSSSQPTVVHSNSGQAGGGELSGYPPPPAAPIIFPTPAGPDHRSKYDHK
jgi:hypothetical protein